MCWHERCIVDERRADRSVVATSGRALRRWSGCCRARGSRGSRAEGRAGLARAGWSAKGGDLSRVRPGRSAGRAFFWREGPVEGPFFVAGRARARKSTRPWAGDSLAVPQGLGDTRPLLGFFYNAKAGYDLRRRELNAFIRVLHADQALENAFSSTQQQGHLHQVKFVDQACLEVLARCQPATRCQPACRRPEP